MNKQIYIGNTDSSVDKNIVLRYGHIFPKPSFRKKEMITSYLFILQRAITSQKKS